MAGRRTAASWTPDCGGTLATTLSVSLAAAALGVAIGVPLAFGVARTRMRFKGLVRAIVVVALVIPDFLVTISYITLFGPNAGLVNVGVRSALGLGDTRGPFDIYSVGGFVLLAAPAAVAFVFIQCVPSFTNMDGSLEEAARIGGARQVRTVLTVTLPVMRHAILSGALLAFSVSLAMYGVPYLLGLDYITVSIREALLLDRDFPLAAALSMTMVVVAFLAVAAFRWATRDSRASAVVSTKGYRPALLEIGRARHLFTAAGLAYAAFAFFIPCATMFVMSFAQLRGGSLTLDNSTLEHYVAVFTSSRTVGAVTNSLVLASVTATIVVALGAVIAYLISRSTLRGRSALDFLAMIPLGVAGTAFAAGIAMAYLRPPLNALALYGTVGILVIAYTTRLVPFGVRTAQSSLVQVSTALEEAARVQGASWLGTMRRITLPLIRPGLVYAWIFVFVQALPELSASVILAGPGTSVIAMEILRLWDGLGGLPRACALGTVVLLVTTVLVAFAYRVTGRSTLDG